ncbi:MAG: serine/threonine-protein kinase [Acidobacteria bacterium]|nr:serine/threonine-protein kinase [Acidobacteriota bacterium]
MTPERWRQIENICHQALELDSERRSAFLAHVCAGDQTLFGEVESMLAAHGRAGDFLEQNALELEAEALAQEKTRALPAQEFSHYRILSRIGAGGMGEVWLARDNNLERNVALKFLPVQFTSDKDRLQRFVREAKAASALNHPNIITIHEIGEAEIGEGKTHFIATEFIEGQTLRQVLANEELSLKKALDIASQAAAALDAAHHAGIIHRDIKPENIMVRPDGLVKVLDFGLAKLDARRSLPEDSVDTSAQTQPGVVKTQPGMILGTLRYMSPEQARGREVDARTDIFSLGVVLYELISKQPLFAGETTADIIAAIIHKEPEPLSDFAPDTPEELERIVRKALAKDARDRYQTARDLQLDLQTLKQDSELSAQLARLRSSGSNRLSGELSRELSDSSRASSPAFRRWGVAGIGIAALLVIAGLVWKLAIQSSSPLPRQLSFDTLFGKKGQDNSLLMQSRFSPDGKDVAYALSDEDGSHIWVRPIGSDGETQITFGKWDDDNPVWSPGSEKIAFISTRGNQLGIWTISDRGGTPTPIKTLGDGQTLANRGRVRMVAWANGGAAIYYEWQYNLYRLDLNTKETTPIIPSNQPFQQPQDFSLSPDEQGIVFIARQNGQYDLWRMSLTAATAQQVTNDPAVDQHPMWLNDASLLYNSTRGEKTQLYSIETSGNSSGGEPVPVSTANHQCQLADFSSKANRILCFEQQDDSDILAVDAKSGAETQLTNDYGLELWAGASPDGQTLLYQAISGDRFVGDIRKGFLFTKPLNSKSKTTRLIPEDGFDAQWSPNGKRIGFLRLAEQTPHLWTIEQTGIDLKQLSADSVFFGGWRNSPPYNRSEARTWDWSPDSTRIAYSSRQNGVANIWARSLDGSQPTKVSTNEDPKLVLKCPIWSPDGERLAFVTETDAQSASGKQMWSVWVGERGQSKMIFQTENRLRLRGWLEKDRLLLALAENVVGSGSQPTTVTLVSLAVVFGEQSAGSEQTLGLLAETYLSNVQLVPDGSKIAFVKAQNRRHDIWTASITGNQLSPPKKITNNSDPDFRFASLTWSPDGKTIYYDKQTRLNLLTTSAASN